LDSQYVVIITLNDCTCSSVEIDSLQNICLENQSFDLNELKITNEAGIWTIADGPDISSLNLTGAQLTIDDNTQAGIYTIEFSLLDQNIPPLCPTTSEFQFEIIEQPFADIQRQETVCNEDNGTEPDFIDLDDLNLNSAIGTWTSTDGLTIDSDNVVSFNGLNVQDYEFIFITTSAIMPCDNDTIPVVISVIDCSCPSLIFNPIDDFCQEDQMFNLFDLIDNADPGIWSILDTPGNTPSIQNQMLVISEDTEAGDYTLTYTLDSQLTLPDCPDSINILFTVNEQPEVEVVTTIEVCNNFIGSLPSQLSLDSMFIAGSDGVWTPTDSNISIDNNIIDFENVSQGVYEFIYTTNTALTPCVDVSDTLFVTVNECVCPVLELPVIDPICNVDLEFDLISLVGSNDPGIWSISSTGVSALPDLINQTHILITPDTEPGTYILRYTLMNTDIPSLCETFVETSIEVIGQPEAEIIMATLACNIDGSPAASDIVDLDDLFIAGDPGEWTTNESITISRPDNIISFNNETPGDYVFTYETNTAIFPCQNQTYDVVITVENCICPPLAFTSSPALCNDDNPIDLNTLLLNGVGIGSWTQIDGPVNNGLSGASEFVVDMLPGGEYEFEYTLTDVVPSGCDMSDVVSITLNETPELSVTPDITVCNQNSSQAPLCIDLRTLVNGDDGSWIEPPSYTGDFSDIGNVCFEGFAAGSQFLFSYTTNTAVAPCLNKTESIQVTVMDCSCPNVNVDDPGPLCNTGDAINLSDLETSGTVSGAWSFISGPEMITIGNTEIFDATDVVSGMYTFQFTPDVAPEALCPQMSQVEIEVVVPLFAGTGNTIDFCENTDLDLDLFSLLDNADQGGEWSEISSVSTTDQAFDATLGMFALQDQSPGTYEFKYEHVGFEPCLDSETTVTVIILENPIADAGETMVLTCSNMSVVLGGPNMSTGPRLIYEWIELSGKTIDEPNDINPEVFEAGTYRVIVTDMIFGCQDEAEVIITEEIGFPSFDTEILPIDCEIDEGGSIIVQNSTGGNGDYIYTIDGGISWTEETTFSGLAPGIYTITLKDGNGCEATVAGLEINERINLNLELGDDVEITFGDTYLLQIQTSALTEEIDSVIWSEDEGIICEGDFGTCSIIEVDPEDVTTYCVRVVDVNGCEETDCVVIREVLDVNVYIANVFTPDVNDFNNRFFVQSDENIQHVKSMRVFDRWGSQVFEGETEHLPNDPRAGWDGTWKNGDVQDGVYTYHVVVVDALNSEHDFVGTVTLIR